MIISLRGTFGSGKSYLVKQLMKRYPTEPYGEDHRGKPLGYRMALGNNQTLGLIGRYDVASGGCDKIQPYSEIWPRVVSFRKRFDHVLFEGALVSSTYGTIGAASEDYGDEMVFVFLDTPLDVCVENIRQRRLSRGKDVPMAEKTIDNVRKKMKAVNNSMKKIKEHHGRRIVILNHKRAPVQVIRLLYRNQPWCSDITT